MEELHVWNHSMSCVGHQSGTNGMSGMPMTGFHGGQRQRREGKISIKDTYGSSGDVSTFCKDGRLEELVTILDGMEQRGFQTYSETCARLLQGCANTRALAVGKRVHAHIVKSGFEPDIFLGNTLVSMYVKCRDVVDARKAFNKMPQRNVISWNAMIAGLAQQGHGQEAFKLLEQMQQEGVKPNKITFMSILNACAGSASLEQGKWLHECIIKAQHESDVRVGTALVSMYWRCGSLVDACRVFFKMPAHDMISWNAMITGSVQSGYGGKAFELFQQMQKEDIKPDKVTYISILNTCSNPKTLEQGKQIHMDIIKAGFEPDVCVGNALLSMYCKNGSVADARQVFDKMPQRDVISWTAMITGAAQYGNSQDAFELFWQMQREGIKPDKVTFISILTACASPTALEQGKQLHEGIIRAGFEADVHIGNALVNMYCKCGSVVDAHQLFEKMPERDVISWNVMIAGLVQQDLNADAIELFQHMQQEGVQPNKVTFISILNACASSAALEQGRWVHASIFEAGFESDVSVGNSLISMYSKCGSIVDAHQFFNKMLQRDVVSWTALITGLAQHGYAEDAFALFQQMQQEGVKPNEVTFISILNACAIPAALEQGKQLHMSIIGAGFQSDVQVGSALVSMYCKCGSVMDAFQVFNTMPQRDVISWNAMLAGFVQHGHDVEAFELYWKMQREGMKADKVTFISILNTCASPDALEQGKCLHACIIKDGFESDVRVGNALVNMYCKCGSVMDASRMFDKMPERNVVTFISILNACAIPAALEQGKRFHADIIKSGFESDVRVGNALISMYCKCGSVIDAHEVFDRMPQRDVISWTTMVVGLAQEAEGAKAFELFRLMRGEDLKLDKITCLSIINAITSLGSLEEGKWLHAHVMKCGFESDVCVCTALVDMYAKCGSIGEARQVFDSILERDVVSWNGMIIGYAQHGRGKEALQLFEQMQGEGAKPDHVTFTGVLYACSHVGLLDEGYHYFLLMSQDHSITPTAMHYGCMVDLLGRVGHLTQAEDLIKKMPFEPGAIVWGALLGACRIHGAVEVAERAAECAV